ETALAARLADAGDAGARQEDHRRRGEVLRAVRHGDRIQGRHRDRQGRRHEVGSVVAMPLLFFALLTVAGPPSTHTTAFWREVVERGYVPPEGSDVPALADELSALLASPDPELRDEIAY